MGHWACRNNEGRGWSQMEHHFTQHASAQLSNGKCFVRERESEVLGWFSVSCAKNLSIFICAGRRADTECLLKRILQNVHSSATHIMQTI